MVQSADAQMKDMGILAVAAHNLADGGVEGGTAEGELAGAVSNRGELS